VISSFHGTLPFFSFMNMSLPLLLSTCFHLVAYLVGYRRIHGRRYEYALGSTEHLTIDRLELMAATLQSHVPSL
jgi:hypothetical protein